TRKGRADGTAAQCVGEESFLDATAPVIVSPSAVTSECPTQPVARRSRATDDCDPTPVIVEEAPESFPMGTTVVIWHATDTTGKSASCQQSVSQVDSTPPALTCSVVAPAECSAPVGTPAIVVATAADTCSATVVLMNSKTSTGGDAS